MSIPFIEPAVSNGNPREQALIRRWWIESKAQQGALIFEYYLNGRYADALWFPGSQDTGREFDGKNAPDRFPVAGQEIVLCEAKLELTPELIGQALVYAHFARMAGATVLETIAFSESGSPQMVEASRHLGLVSLVAPLVEEGS